MFIVNISLRGSKDYIFLFNQCHDDHQCFFQENLAFGKPTVQKNGPAHGGFARLGVDGNSKTNYYARSCTLTPGTVNPWWRVDLGQIEPVSEVYIVNQENEPWWQRQTNFEIRVGRLAFLLILYCFVHVKSSSTCLLSNTPFSFFCH